MQDLSMDSFFYHIRRYFEIRAIIVANESWMTVADEHIAASTTESYGPRVILLISTVSLKFEIVH